MNPQLCPTCKQPVTGSKSTRALEIVMLVSKETNISPLALMGDNKTHDVAQARHMALHLLRDFSGLGSGESAEFLKRDRTMTPYAVRKSLQLIKTNKTYRAQYNRIRNKLWRG